MTARRLQIWALRFGFAAAVILTLFPPGLIPRYTLDGRGFFQFVGEPTCAGRVWGVIQLIMSGVGPLLLVASFSLELLALKKTAPDPPQDERERTE